MSDQTESIDPLSDWVPDGAAAPSGAGLPSGASRPSRIGNYKILGELGKGAMGVVYLAEQTAPIRRRVALKLIQHHVHSERTRDRFEAERQALATLSHRNIASVYDAGSTDHDNPYFVMEYVPGLPITDYCDRYRLDTTQRIELLRDVCGAVDHAHQRGIIHRDLKPSNLLVTLQGNDAVPKVIDFGVAKAIQGRLIDRALQTEPGQPIGTPEYMSPEQAENRGLGIDHRTDIYSLGVLLYELLVGALPFESQTLRGAGTSELQRIIREEEPPKPSVRLSSLGDELTTVAANRSVAVRSLGRQIRGPLDKITMTAMAKDPTRRYSWASELGEDLGRYLRNEPVVAVPPSLWYYLKKRASKHRGVLAAAVCLLVVAGLTVGYAMRTRQLVVADANVLYSEAKWEAHIHPHQALQKLEAAIEAVPDFVEARLDRAYLLKRQGRPEEAITAAEQIVRRDPQTGAAHLLLGILYQHVNTTVAADHKAAARRLLPEENHHAYYLALSLDRSNARRAVDLLSSVIAENSTDLEARLQRAVRYYEVCQFDDMLDDARKLCELAPKSASFWNLHGVALAKLKRLVEAQRAYTRAIDAEPECAACYNNRGNALMAEGRAKEAVADFDRAIDLQPNLTTAYANRALYHLASNSVQEAQRDVAAAIKRDPQSAVTWYVKGLVALEAADTRAADDAFTRAIQLDPYQTAAYRNRAVSIRLVQEDYVGALEDLDAVLARCNPPEDTLFHQGVAFQGLGDTKKAQRSFKQALEVGFNPAAVHHSLGRVHLQREEYAKAVDEFSEAQRLHSEAPQVYEGRGVAHQLLGQDDLALEDFAAAAENQDGIGIAGPALRMWEIHMLAGRRQEADDALSLALGYQDLPRWDRTVLEFCRGEISHAQLQEEAKLHGAVWDTEYYIGLKALTEGQISDAAARFESVAQSRRFKLYEYYLACWHLERLNESPAPRSAAKSP